MDITHYFKTIYNIFRSNEDCLLIFPYKYDGYYSDETSYFTTTDAISLFNKESFNFSVSINTNMMMAMHLFIIIMV